MPRWFFTHFVGPDGPDESDFFYLADAEVDTNLAAGSSATCFGKVLTFRFPRAELVWRGHLDDTNPSPGYGWPRETGNARICLHNIFLLPEKFPPLGFPFGIGSSFEVFDEETKIGTCTVTRVIDYTKQKVMLDLKG